MSKKLFFINEDPQEVAKVLFRLKPGSIENACLQKGFPPATNANCFCLTFGKNGMNLCYKYFENPTVLLSLMPQELPEKGWRFEFVNEHLKKNK